MRTHSFLSAQSRIRRGPAMQTNARFLGLHVHAKTISAAVAGAWVRSGTTAAEHLSQQSTHRFHGIGGERQAEICVREIEAAGAPAH
jgi:hypothetical protein